MDERARFGGSFRFCRNTSAIKLRANETFALENRDAPCFVALFLLKKNGSPVPVLLVRPYTSTPNFVGAIRESPLL